jgi:hypothetical protein
MPARRFRLVWPLRLRLLKAGDDQREEGRGEHEARRKSQEDILLLFGRATHGQDDQRTQAGGEPRQQARQSPIIGDSAAPPSISGSPLRNHHAGQDI